MPLIATITSSIATSVGVLGALIALATLVKALLEYMQQGRQKRAEHFFELRRKLKENVEFSRVAGLLDEASLNDDEAASAREELRRLSFQIKRDYLGLFEEVAIAMNSGLIKPQVAHYMFGYYALLCWTSDDFWINVNKLSDYWSLFDDFCKQMKAEQNSFEFRRRDFKF
ncbi:MAG TPA: hypothetical protein VG816_06415 [Solirubrobacterales bacterium]|nr:hypothetical protein [Solirubrobacterales bacterium]